MSCSIDSNLKYSQSKARSSFVQKEALNKGILRIHIPIDKPKSLAIRNPSGEWFVLQSQEESIEVMPQRLFDSVDKMEFKFETLEGVVWRGAVKSTELVFKKSGEYLIYFANNLETEPDNTYFLQDIINVKLKY